MRAESILEIQNLLDEKENEVQKIHEAFRESLRDKYKDDWIDKYLTAEERTMLEHHRQQANLWKRVNEDFSNHDW